MINKAARALAQRSWGGRARLLLGDQGSLALGRAFISTTCALRELQGAAEVARALEAANFKETTLAELSKAQPSIPYGQLIDHMVQQQGFTPMAAEDVVGRLERSGALLNLQGTVLLRPGEVAEALALVLPGSPGDTRQRLEAAQQDLGRLEAQLSRVAGRAAARQRAVVWGGLASQGLLWALLFRLTYYELSWDVMEPVAFFVGGGQALLCYAYFMATRQDFSWQAALERHVGRWEAQALERAGFDAQRYAHLKREVRRLGDLLTAQRRREAGGG